MSDHSSSATRPVSPVAGAPPTARPYRFTLDPGAARRPGPGSVSEATEPAQAEYVVAQPRPDLLPSASTLVVGALPADWSSSKHGFHGLCTSSDIAYCELKTISH